MLLLVGVFLSSSAALGAERTSAQWVVVTAPAFRKALEPLIAQRKSQGFHVAVVSVTDTLNAGEIAAGESTRLCDRVHKVCRDHDGPSLVLLVGAVGCSNLDNDVTKVVPSTRGTAGRMKGQPTDNPYGCPDGGRVPTVAVGRFPARSEAEVVAMVEKTLRFENDHRPHAWRRRLTVLAGIPAYNPLVDRLVERLALARFDRLSPSWSGRAIYTNPQSRFCVPNERLHKQALEYVQDGQTAILYLGHSNTQGLYGGGAPFLDRHDWARLRIARGPGVFVTFGCNGCQLTGNDGEGYGVAAIRNPGGPCAVFGSHGICFAAMVQLAADGLFESTFSGKLPDRLGEAWLALKRGVGKGSIDSFTYTLLDSVDGDARIPQEAQRQEHLEMFLLLGDPALRLPSVPEDLEVGALTDVLPGATLAINGKLPKRLADGQVRLTLERGVATEPVDLEPLPRDFGRTEVMQANHNRANRFVLAQAEVTARKEKFEARLSLPKDLPWPKLLLRAYAATDAEEGMVVLPVEVRRPLEKPRP
jgi:hypothetical protein